jgi:hypothetical protein
MIDDDQERVEFFLFIVMSTLCIGCGVGGTGGGEVAERKGEKERSRLPCRLGLAWL